jgi:hypothetical protein
MAAEVAKKTGMTPQSSGCLRDTRQEPQSTFGKLSAFINPLLRDVR